MKLWRKNVWICASVAAVVAGAVLATAAPVGASGKAAAGFSIDSVKKELTVTFSARASGFSSPVVSYVWVFRDGESTSTSTPTVTHTYPSPSMFFPSLTESDRSGDVASANGTLNLFICPAGTSHCSDSLQKASSVQLLQASGPISATARAEVHLFVGTYRIPTCQPTIAPTVAVTNTGFTGTLTLTIKYTTSQLAGVGTTCFSSAVLFADAGGQPVHNGALPACQAAGPTPPCVQSISTTGSRVTKVLLVPAGDPKVGAP
jgi:hypothetical protein